jgi:hypothetical protein
VGQIDRPSPAQCISASGYQRASANFLPCRTGHPAAFFRTFLTSLGATLAVLNLVLRALRAAGIADFGAYPTDLVDEVRSAAHVSRRGPADRSAVLVKPKALGHLGNFALAQASVGAVLALLGTSHAGFDARLVLLMSHLDSSFVLCRGSWTGTWRLVVGLAPGQNYERQCQQWPKRHRNGM